MDTQKLHTYSQLLAFAEKRAKMSNSSDLNKYPAVILRFGVILLPNQHTIHTGDFLLLERLTD